MAFQIQQDLFIFTLCQRFETLLRVALVGADGDRHFAVPSAGALYPYVFDLTFEIPRGSLRYKDVPLSGLSAVLKDAPLRGATGLQISMAFQPERARAKYGNRGLTYGMQDCGHVLANLKLASGPLGLATNVTVHPMAWAVGDILPNAIPVFDIDIRAAEESRGDLSASINKLDFLSAMMRRGSASAFDTAPCAPNTVAKILARSQQIANHDPQRLEKFGFLLALRDAEHLWTVQGSDGLDGLGKRPARGVPLDPSALFFAQEFTTNAAALVFFSAPKSGPEAVLDQCLCAGYAGQCLYIAAEMDGIGACCVGGFDYNQAEQIFGLPSDQYAAYAMLIGRKGIARPKVDRRRNLTLREAIVEFPATRSDVMHTSPLLETN